MIYFFLFYFLIKICECESNVFETKIFDYFKSDTYLSFQKQWQKSMKSYENAIQLALKDNYGYKGMNVYIKKSPDWQRIANGFYVYDGVVGVLCQTLRLGELPHLTSPEVTFALASNVLRVEAGLSKMFVYTQYTLFRNHTDILLPGEDLANHSPFTHPDVQETGSLIIIAEDCTLSGLAIVKLNGQSIDLGHNTFKITDCKFSVEISASRTGLAPVIAPYFNEQQSDTLEKLISKRIRGELIPKLQSSIFTYVNTTAIFASSLPKYRQVQRKLFKDTSKEFINMIRNLNTNTMRINQGIAALRPFSVKWNVCVEYPCESGVTLKGIDVYGLDTVYSSYNGGPYKLQSLKVGELMRYNYLQVRGRISLMNDSVQRDHEFFAEIYDAGVNVEIDLDKDVNACNFIGWRSLELSILDFKTSIEERANANALISAHVLNELPKALTEHTLHIFETKPLKLSYAKDPYNLNIFYKHPERPKYINTGVGSVVDSNFKKKKFDKRGEISKGGVYNRGKNRGKNSFTSNKEKFDKTGELYKNLKRKPELSHNYVYPYYPKPVYRPSEHTKGSSENVWASYIGNSNKNKLSKKHSKSKEHVANIQKVDGRSDTSSSMSTSQSREEKVSPYRGNRGKDNLSQSISSSDSSSEK